MAKFVCLVCGWIYDENTGDMFSKPPIPPTKFNNLPENWSCPICGAKRDKFKKIGDFYEG